jgi:uncharacterized protein (UPF0333 family)
MRFSRLVKHSLSFVCLKFTVIFKIRSQIMRKSILNLSLALGFVVLGFGQAAFAGQQTTTRTGPNGNSQVTNRTYGNGQQTTTRTGPNGKAQVTNRTYGNGQQTTTRTGPNGNVQTTKRTISH